MRDLSNVILIVKCPHLCQNHFSPPFSDPSRTASALLLLLRLPSTSCLFRSSDSDSSSQLQFLILLQKILPNHDLLTSQPFQKAWIISMPLRRLQFVLNTAKRYG
jgi:hypothetical protein